MFAGIMPLKGWCIPPLEVVVLIFLTVFVGYYRHKTTQADSDRARIRYFVYFELRVKPARFFYYGAYFVGGYRVYAAPERNELNEIYVKVFGSVCDVFCGVVKAGVISPLIANVDKNRFVEAF